MSCYKQFFKDWSTLTIEISGSFESSYTYTNGQSGTLERISNGTASVSLSGSATWERYTGQLSGQHSAAGDIGMLSETDKFLLIAPCCCPWEISGASFGAGTSTLAATGSVHTEYGRPGFLVSADDDLAGVELYGGLFALESCLCGAKFTEPIFSRRDACFEGVWSEELGELVAVYSGQPNGLLTLNAGVLFSYWNLAAEAGGAGAFSITLGSALLGVLIEDAIFSADGLTATSTVPDFFRAFVNNGTLTGPATGPATVTVTLA